MIIKTKPTRCFATIPNRIFEDDSLCIAAKGLLGYLLSRPSSWTVRHGQLQRKLGVGRKALERLMNELIVAGYVERDQEQTRDESNRFTTLNYVVRNVPKLRTNAALNSKSDVHATRRRGPVRETHIDNNKHAKKTERNNIPPTPLPRMQAGLSGIEGDQYSHYGQHALASGLVKVFVDSKPFRAWVEFRGADGIPPVDEAIVGGLHRRIIWMPTLFPPTTRQTNGGLGSCDRSVRDSDDTSSEGGAG